MTVSFDQSNRRSTHQPLDKLPLSCPLDGIRLKKQKNSYVCERGHSYDVAAQGYLNLLPVQLKASKDPGDSKAMVMARRQVLEKEHFSKLSNQISAKVSEYNALSAVGKSRLIVDAGCGEGYYTARMNNAICQNPTSKADGVLGVDISKWSVMAAARKYPSVGFVVGTNKTLPVAQGTANIITSLFGFESWNAWAELQLTDQWVIVVDAGPRHLYELRQLIYSEVRVHDVPLNELAISAGYELVDTGSLIYTSQVNSSETLLQILEMTPHGRRTQPESRLKIERLDALDLTIDAVIRVYRRC